MSCVAENTDTVPVGWDPRCFLAAVKHQHIPVSLTNTSYGVTVICVFDQTLEGNDRAPRDSTKRECLESPYAKLSATPSKLLSF
jgi:hypothetical protein